MLLVIDVDLIDAPIRFENTSGGSELFPHIYCPLPRKSIVAVEPLSARSDGTFDPWTVESIMSREDERAIRSTVAAWLNATRRGDTQAVLDLMTEDALFLVPGQPPMTKAVFEAASKSQAAARLSFEGVSEIREIQVEGSMACMISHLTVTAVPGDGSEPIKRAGHTLTIFRKVGDRWLLARDANLLSKI